jgi:NAD-reducing hydrogenase large subunit
LRQFGQEIIEQLGGKKIHPAWAVPGGVRAPLSEAGRAQIHDRIPEARATILGALDRFKRLLEQYKEESQIFGNFPTLFMGLVGDDGAWEHYGGQLRFVDGAGNIVADRLDPTRYHKFIGEAAEPWSYLKFPYYRPIGYPDGAYRVGPLARLNICTQIGTPLADQELREFRSYGNGAVTSSFFYHYARLIEILAAIEHIDLLLGDPDILSERLRADAGINQAEGVGVSEAPRGTLFHHYQVDADGLITRVNLLIATGQNNLAMNRAVAQIARHYIHGPQIPEAMLNRVEAGIRAFDPCLSCSTHAAGAMPLHLALVGPDGALLHELWR